MKKRSAPFLTFRFIERERNGPRAGAELRGLYKLLLWLYNVTPALPFDPRSGVTKFPVKSWRGRVNRNRVAVSSSFASWNLGGTKFALSDCARLLKDKLLGRYSLSLLVNLTVRRKTSSVISTSGFKFSQRNYRDSDVLNYNPCARNYSRSSSKKSKIDRCNQIIV